MAIRWRTTNRRTPELFGIYFSSIRCSWPSQILSTSHHHDRIMCFKARPSCGRQAVASQRYISTHQAEWNSISASTSLLSPASTNMCIIEQLLLPLTSEIASHMSRPARMIKASNCGKSLFAHEISVIETEQLYMTLSHTGRSLSEKSRVRNGPLSIDIFRPVYKCPIPNATILQISSVHPINSTHSS